MADLSVGGLATGIDTKTLVAQLMALERQPEKILTSRKTKIQSQLDVYNILNTSLGKLKDLMAGMNTPATFLAKSMAVADSSVLTAQASTTAVPGSHTVVVNSLAKFQRQVSAGGYTSVDDLNFNTGAITVSGGTAPLTLTINEGQNSLSGIAAAINSSGGNLTATIINDGSSAPFRLVITGKDTSNYTIDAAGLTTPPAAPNGAAYANLTFPQSGPTYSAGSLASFSVDGVAITKGSNSISDVIPGVTLNLLKEGGATTTITVSNDSAAVTTKINNFVSSYNDAMAYISKQSAYDTTTNKGGTLSGDSTIRSLKAALQSIVSSKVSGVSGPFAGLSQVGISTNQKDGTLSVDSAKLATALSSNFEGVSELFTRNSKVPDLASDQYGIAEQFNLKLAKLTHAFVGPDSYENGLISTRINGLSRQMTDIDKQVARMELLMVQKEANLNKQFIAMENLVSSLTGKGNSLISILNNMNK
jgi:flagellar hook-associated protein 2